MTSAREVDSIVGTRIWPSSVSVSLKNASACPRQLLGISALVIPALARSFVSRRASDADGAGMRPPGSSASSTASNAGNSPSFTTTDDLRVQVLDFIAYFNRTLAKPFKWTYLVKPLHV
jgi:hypothetical protein